MIDESGKEVKRNSYDENMEKFREILMFENMDFVSKLKKYKKTDFRRKIVLNQIRELKKLSELSKVWVSVPFVKQTYDFPVITVDSRRAGSNIDALRLAINDLGWKEYPNGSGNKSCHVVWNSCSFNENRNNSGSFVNKYPGITQCLHKVAFSRIIETMRTLFPDYYKFYPPTWYLPHQMVDFSLYCRNREASKKPAKYYIVKPDAGTQGDGIYLIQKPQDYKISSKTYVVQEYLANPLLLDGFKFDLRIYALLLSLDPLKVYLCNEGLARFCTKQYVPPSSDNLNISYIHLTNYSLNKKSSEFVHTQNLNSGSKRTVSSVLAALKDKGYNISNIWQNLEKLVYKTVLAILPQLKVHYINEVVIKSDSLFSNNQTENENDRPSCFQILGFDVLIMDDLKPVLLEVNSNPSMRLDCEMEIAPGIVEYYVSKVDVKIKRPLVRDTLKLLQQDICNKFKLEMHGTKDLKELEKNISNILPNIEVKYKSKEDYILSEMNNMHNICRKWSTESKFRSRFVKIDKMNDIPSINYKSSRSSSLNDLTDSVKAEETQSELRTRENGSSLDTNVFLKEHYDEFNEIMAENLLFHSGEKENVSTKYGKSAVHMEDSNLQNNNSSKSLFTESSCLTLISTDSYKDLFDDLRILEETAIIFYNSMGHRYSENMGATAFRTFGRQCKLHTLGFNHAMIDLIYIEVQRRWAFINHLDNKQGLCYQAFLEAFFRIAFAKFGDSSKAPAVQNLIDHCKKSIGLDNFNWTKTLYPANDQCQNRIELKNYYHSKSGNRCKILNCQNNNSIPQESEIRSALSNNSLDSYVENLHKESNNKKFHMDSSPSKFELIKTIHEMYRKELENSKNRKIPSNTNNDSDSITSSQSNKSTESSKNKSVTLPSINGKMGVAFSINKDDSLKKAYRLNTNSFDKLKVDSIHKRLTEKKNITNYEGEIKTVGPRTPSTNGRPGFYLGNNIFTFSDRNTDTKLHSDNYANIVKTGKLEFGSSKNHQLSPLTNERMRNLISIYGAQSQNFLKRSMDKGNKKVPVLKPI